MRNINAKMKNGATPSHWVGNRRPERAAGGADCVAVAGAETLMSVMVWLPKVFRAAMGPPGITDRY